MSFVGPVLEDQGKKSGFQYLQVSGLFTSTACEIIDMSVSDKSSSESSESYDCVVLRVITTTDCT